MKREYTNPKVEVVAYASTNITNQLSVVEPAGSVDIAKIKNTVSLDALKN